ncbi:MAG: PrgI family protein [Anaerolineales bacterium]|nr:PrgI family protein [Anaerolineales bacterium]
MRPPSRIDVSERRFFGLTFRQLAILASAAVLALACLVGLKTWPFWLRIVLVLAWAAVGLIWAFWQSQGQTLEQRLLDVLVFHRRTRYLLHRAVRDQGQARAAWPTAEAKPATQPRKVPQTAVVGWSPALLWITANAIGISLLFGLTFWLSQGGAHQLRLIWHGL